MADGAVAPLRIGIWFDTRHFAFGGPSVVLIGTILGFIRDAEVSGGRPVCILLNEPGDINWCYGHTDNMTFALQKAPNMTIGPMCFAGSDIDTSDYTTHPVWKHGGRHFVVPSQWMYVVEKHVLPFGKPEGGDRTLSIWAAGVDTLYFRPMYSVRTEDYFIYFKSQEYVDLNRLHVYLFSNYFSMRGNVMVYYCYDKAMLREAASKSKFCIVLDNAETQGLASLEIMSCDCPLFVLDCKMYKGNKLTYMAASSVTCWDESRCGMKSSFDTLEADFPQFLSRLSTYTPRDFVLESYSYEASARKLRRLMETREFVGA